jgi:trimethylamine:corrinoid methyltransferase-like protein
VKSTADATISGGDTPPCAALGEAQAQRIEDTAFRIAQEIGVQFDPDPRVLDLFSGGGCDVSADGRVKLPRERVREAIDSMAKSVQIWDRPGTGSIEIGDGNTRFFPGMTCIEVVDPETREVRQSTREDLARNTRVADALADIDGVCVTCKIVEHSDLQGELEEFAVLLANTSKPLEYLCENDAALEAVIEMAAAVRGGADRLFERPYFMHMVTPLPLHYDKTHSDQIIRAVECGIPVNTGTFNLGGASAPMSMAGNIAHGLATDFGAMVLGQIVRRGSFCIGSSDIGFMDPLTGGLGGFSQALMAELAVCQIRRRLGYPSMTGIGGINHGASLDHTSAAQVASTMLHAFFSRPATCEYLGMSNGGMIYSLHLLLLCHDLAGLLRKLWQGIRVDDETLALDLVREVGPQGSYLAQRHTDEHCRTEPWRSRYFRVPRSADAGALHREDLVDRIDADLRRILADHRPAPLPASLRAQIDAILEKSGAAPLD